MRTFVMCHNHNNLIGTALPFAIDRKTTIHCVECGCVANRRDPDEFDVLAESFGVTREVVKIIDAVAAKSKPRVSLLEYMRWELNLKNVSNGYAPVTAVCNSCGSAFRFFRTHPSTAQTAPRFCVFCGENAVSVHQDPDLDAWEVLAAHYNTSVAVIKVLYSAFTQQNTHTNFRNFVTMLVQQAKGE